MTSTLSLKLKLSAAACAAIVTVALAANVAAHDMQKPGERVIYVSVMDGTGAPIPDMKAAEFVVKEDGVAREVVSVARATEPISYALLLDSTGPAIPAVLDIRAGVKAFCELLLSVEPKTQFSFTEFGAAANTVRPFTSSLPELETALGKFVPQRSAAPVLNEAFVEVAKQFAKMPATARRVIISINMEPTKESSNLEPQLVGEEVRKSGATVWAVSIAEDGKRNATRENLLKILAASSGGRAIVVPRVNLSEVLRTFAANSFSQYAVTFKTGDAPAKQTDITSTRPQVLAMSMRWSSK